MKQRVPSRAWFSPGAAVRRPRVLVEDDDPALAISDFSLFQKAGYDVAFCSGPGSARADCPLLRGEDCAVLAGADAVLHGLDPRLGIAAAIRRTRPGIAVVAGPHRRSGGRRAPVPDGCVPLPAACSVHGQIDALGWALAGSPR